MLVQQQGTHLSSTNTNTMLIRSYWNIQHKNKRLITYRHFLKHISREQNEQRRFTSSNKTCYRKMQNYRRYNSERFENSKTQIAEFIGNYNRPMASCLWQNSLYIKHFKWSNMSHIRNAPKYPWPGDASRNQTAFITWLPMIFMAQGGLNNPCVFQVD